MKYTLISLEQRGTDPRGNHKLMAKFGEYQGGNTAVYWAAKNLPRIGDTFDGEITDGEYGPRFKRTFDQTGGFGASTAPTTAEPHTNYSRRDNGDGQRKGMAVNNAANYVKDWSVKEGKKLSPAELAKAVKPYADAIYSIDPQQADLTTNNDTDTLSEALGIDFGAGNGSGSDS